MSQAEKLIEEAIMFAQNNNYKIARGAIFDTSTNPTKCNALGAVMLKIGKDSLVKNGFANDWLKELCNYIGEEPLWVWKFISGFDYGNEISLTYEGCFGDNHTEKDKVSRLGVKLANRYCK